MDGELPTLDEVGSLTSAATPLAVQFDKDLRLLEGISGTETFFEEWNNNSNSWSSLFLDEDMTDLLVRLDAAMLRAVSWDKMFEDVSEHKK